MTAPHAPVAEVVDADLFAQIVQRDFRNRAQRRAAAKRARREEGGR